MQYKNKYLAELVELKTLDDLVLSILTNDGVREVESLVSSVRSITENSHAGPLSVGSVDPIKDKQRFLGRTIYSPVTDVVDGTSSSRSSTGESTSSNNSST